MILLRRLQNRCAFQHRYALTINSTLNHNALLSQCKQRMASAIALIL